MLDSTRANRTIKGMDTPQAGPTPPLVHSILESISDGVFTVDPAWRITSFNRAAEEITGVTREDALGAYCWDVFRADACEGTCPLRRTLETGTPIINRTAYIVNAEGRRIPVSLSTAVLRDETGAMRGGAETFRDLSVEVDLKERLSGRTGEIISHSSTMRRVLGMLPDVAASDAPVVILGETGSGKELVARAVHDLSLRRERPFVAVNCAALPDTLLESELFGYRKGAFTDARADKPGRFALAEGGTLFLDEIGDISPALQVKLLRVLQQRCYEPLGATQPEHTDVRILTATHHDLDALVAAGTFRRDLYYRLHVVRLEVPALRDRPEDIPLLADHFVRRFNHLRGMEVEGLAPETLAILYTYPFPGNVRELENLIERAFVLCHHGLIQPTHLPDLRAVPASAAAPPRSPRPGAVLEPGSMFMENTGASGISRHGLHDTARQAEADAILEALRRHGYHRGATARALGIHPSTLHRKIRALGLQLPAQDGRYLSRAPDTPPA